MAQTPVKYSVTPEFPTRCGAVYEPPYTIINLGTESNQTVWIADNAGLIVGNGTPLYPGTSFVWQKPGDFWIIGESNSDIVVTSDAIDWDPNPIALAIAILNSGVLLVDKPEILYQDTLNASNAFLSGIIDITRFQSAIVFLVVDNFGGGNDDIAQISFYHDPDDPFSILAFKQLQFVSDPNGGDRWLATIPLQGAAMQISSQGTSTDVAVIVMGSNRPQESLDQTIVNQYSLQHATNLYAEFHPTLAAGNVLLLQLNPWIGELEVDVSFSSAAAMGASEVRWVRQFSSDGLVHAFRRDTPILKFGTQYGFKDKIVVAGDALRFDVINSTAVAFTNLTVVIRPVRGISNI